MDSSSQHIDVAGFYGWMEACQVCTSMRLCSHTFPVLRPLHLHYLRCIHTHRVDVHLLLVHPRQGHGADSAKVLHRLVTLAPTSLHHPTQVLRNNIIASILTRSQDRGWGWGWEAPQQDRSAVVAGTLALVPAGDHTLLRVPRAEHVQWNGYYTHVWMYNWTYVHTWVY